VLQQGGKLPDGSAGLCQPESIRVFLAGIRLRVCTLCSTSANTRQKEFEAKSIGLKIVRNESGMSYIFSIPPIRAERDRGLMLYPSADIRDRRSHSNYQARVRQPAACHRTTPWAGYRSATRATLTSRLQTACHFFSISTFFSASTWRGIFLPSISFGTGMLTSTTPFLKVAWILSAAAPSGRLSRRSKEP
jgi:hypothetical protein